MFLYELIHIIEYTTYTGNVSSRYNHFLGLGALVAQDTSEWLVNCENKALGPCDMIIEQVSWMYPREGTIV